MVKYSGSYTESAKNDDTPMLSQMHSVNGMLCGSFLLGAVQFVYHFSIVLDSLTFYFT